MEITQLVRPTVAPLGDSALLVRFGAVLDDQANRQALAFAKAIIAEPVSGVVEVVPSLVSVLVRYDPTHSDPARLAGEISLRIAGSPDVAPTGATQIPVRFGGEDGPDLEQVAEALQMNVEAFIASHNAGPLRVLATGFAPGFVYCGFHRPWMELPRRTTVRPMVRAGSVLFAAGQTAIAATDIPTGWHVIGHTDFRNFDPSQTPPTRLLAGDMVSFRVAP